MEGEQKVYHDVPRRKATGTLKEMIDESNKLLALERKACITKTIEWFFIQLNEGDMECGDIEKFVANYKKYMEE